MMLLPVPLCAAPEEMLTMTPSPVARSNGTKARIVANGPRTLAVSTASIRLSSSASRSLCATIRVKPAELTRISARPNPCLTASATLRICALSSIDQIIVERLEIIMRDHPGEAGRIDEDIGTAEPVLDGVGYLADLRAVLH